MKCLFTSIGITSNQLKAIMSLPVAFHTRSQVLEDNECMRTELRIQDSRIESLEKRLAETKQELEKVKRDLALEMEMGIFSCSWDNEDQQAKVIFQQRITEKWREFYDTEEDWEERFGWLFKIAKDNDF